MFQNRLAVGTDSPEGGNTSGIYPERYPTHVEINARFDLSVLSDKTVPSTAIAEMVVEKLFNAQIVQAIVESVDEQCVKELCGEKHPEENGEKRFQRGRTDGRSAATTAGGHDFTLHDVKDTAAGEYETSYFKPGEEAISFNGQKYVQEDIGVERVYLATSLSYRDAEDRGDSFLSMPSADTINRRAKEYGSNLKEYLLGCIEGTEADAVLVDGT